ncbi:hypothetical protein OB994_25050 [Bacillus cereus]|nr:hypothetical protein [Bacillus cereus]
MNINDINAEIVSIFEKNGKKYFTLELSEDTNKKIEWPDPDDIKIEVIFENNKLIFIAYYKDKEKGRIAFDLSDVVCGDPKDVDLFSVTIFGVKCTIYFKDLWICAHLDVPDKYADYSFQVWARAGSAKTKLIDTIEGTVDIPDDMIGQSMMNPCLIGLGVALTDSKVLAAISRKIRRRYHFRGYKCMDEIANPELVKIHFDFDCEPERACHIDPSLYVTVNLITKTVTHIDGENT